LEPPQNKRKNDQAARAKKVSREEMLRHLPQLRRAVADRMSYAAIGKLYGVSATTVVRFAKEHGFYEDRTEVRPLKLSTTKEFIAQVDEELIEGTKLSDLARRYRVSIETLRRFCHDNGITLRTPAQNAAIRAERRRAEAKARQVAQWEARYQRDLAKRDARLAQRQAARDEKRRPKT
jgi:hypothetical protein